METPKTDQYFMLSTCNVFSVFSNLQRALEAALEAGAKVPAAGARTSDTLAEVVKQCEAAIKQANRLRAADVQPANSYT